MIFHPLKKILKCLGGLLVVALLWSFAHEATAQPTKTASPNASKKATATSEGNVEKKLRAKLHQQFGQDTVIGAITKTPYGNAAVHGGLYEVFMNGRVHYTDAQLTFFIAGMLIDPKTQQNYSEQQLRKHQAISLADLPPLSNAILVNRGNATKTIFVFADPLCKHCQDLEKYLSDYPTLTIYAYLVPNDQVNRGATSIAKAMWCSPDKSRAYVDYMVRGILPANAGGDCPTPFAENQRIMSAINIIKTPGIVFGDGYRIEGTPTPTQLKTLIQNTPR